MAAVAATASCVAAPTCFVQKNVASTSSARVVGVNGLPVLRMSKITCSAEKKESAKGLPMLAASGASFAAFAAAHPGAAYALVDERLSTEGTGLSLGVSNPKLTWILVGVTALVWALYFVYSAGLPEGDDDSGLSL